nr:uncharacterized protein LOC131775458 [Pocillopora verrucosa]
MASYPIIQEREGEWTSNEMIEILGFRIPAFFVYGSQGPELLCDFITNFQTKPDDVFIVSYPKSGTTWVQEIVWQIYHDGEISHKVLGDRILYIEKALLPESTHLDIKSMPSPRLFKSHLSYDAIPKSTDEAKTTCKYIYVARNPKDAAVSSYKFMGSFGTNGMNAPWEFYAKLFIEGKTVYNNWSDHVLGWWKHRHDPNVLFLKYEDLQKDLQSNVRMISKFLNKPLSEEVISLITEQCTFKGMMKNVQSFTLGDKIEGPKFLCKGAVGSWKEHFTPELNQRFEKEVLAKLKGSGLAFDFEFYCSTSSPISKRELKMCSWLLTPSQGQLEIIWQIYNNGETTSKNIFERVPFLEFSTSPILGEFADIAKVPSPRLIKSHLPYSIIPKGSSDGTKCKYIYIARNPKDVAVSYFHFTVSLKSSGNGYNGPWEFFSKLFIDGNVGWNKWNDHVPGWWKHKDDPNVLFLKYEDLKKDLPSQVRLTANFLNKPLSENIINRIAEQCSFNGMTKDLSRYMVHVNESQTSILRKGVVGDWKNYFTPELNERFEKEVLSKIEGTGLEFDFEL